jgi:hypothetical protein
MRLLSLAIPGPSAAPCCLRQMMSAFGFLNFSQSRERPDTQSPLLSAGRRLTTSYEGIC